MYTYTCLYFYDHVLFQVSPGLPLIFSAVPIKREASTIVGMIRIPILIHAPTLIVAAMVMVIIVVMVYWYIYQSYRVMNIFIVVV